MRDEASAGRKDLQEEDNTVDERPSEESREPTDNPTPPTCPAEAREAPREAEAGGPADVTPPSEPQAAPNRAPTAGIIEPRTPTVTRFARAEPLVWPMSAMWAVFAPRSFYRVGVGRMSALGAVLTVMLNLVLSEIIAVGAIAYEEGMPRFHDLEDFLLFVLSLAGVLFGAVALVEVLAMAVAPGSANAGTIGRAMTKAHQLMAGVTSVFPVATAIVAIMGINEREISSLAREIGGRPFRDFIEVSVFAVPIIWPFAMMVMGLMLDRDQTGSGGRRMGECRCEACGYDLTVIPAERQCPECGHPVDPSLNPAHRMPLPVDERGPAGSIRRRVAAAATAFVTPVRFWQERQVRASNIGPRNAFMWTLLATAVAAPTLLVVFGGVQAAVMDPRDQDVWQGLLMAGFLGVPILVVGLLLVNGMIVLMAMGLSAVRGNHSRIDEMARVGYQTIAAAVPMQGGFLLMIAMAITTMIMLSEAGMRSYRAPALYEWASALLLTVGILSAGAFLLTMLWGLVAAVRAMGAARWANR